jgi:hypothetical protein
VARKPDAAAEKRASDFGRQLFPVCETCCRSAEAVHVALEALAGTPLIGLNCDATIREILSPVIENLPSSRSSSEMDDLDVVEFLIALEEELGPKMSREKMQPVLEDATCEGVLKRLLGDASDHCRWDAATVWLRSVRGVINERSRWQGGCSCPQEQYAG